METEEAIHKFLTACRARKLSPKTMAWYSWILERFALYYPGLPQSPEQIEHFLAVCSRNDETCHGHYRTLHVFYNFLYQRNGCTNPMAHIKPPRRKHKLPHVLTQDEINRLLAYAHPGKIKAMLVFLADTGARIGEAAHLQPDDLKQTPWGYVASIDGKTGQRLIPIKATTYNLLVDNLPFVYPVDTLKHQVRKAFRNAGVKGSAQTLRHTFATLWTGSEFALQHIMGHSSFQTLKIYRRMRMEYLCQQHDQFSPIHNFQQGRFTDF